MRKSTALWMVAVVAVMVAIWIFMSPSRERENEVLARMGISLPCEVKIQIVRGSPYTGSLYVRVAMDRETFLQLLKQSPFNDIPQTATTNPFLAIQETFENWNPKQIGEGVGGLRKLAGPRRLIFFFDVRNPTTVDGWFLIIG